MDSAERISALTGMSDPWDIDRLRRLAVEALSRWRVARERLGVSPGFPPYRMFDEIVPPFALPERIVSLARATPVEFHGPVLGYLSWVECPQTNALPNPFEPLVEILRHGGSFRKNHGWLDISAWDGGSVGIPTFSNPPDA